MKKKITGFGLTVSIVLAVTIILAFGSELDRSLSIRSESKCSFSSIPNLTAEQSSQIRALRQGLLNEIKPLQRDHAAKEAELQTLESTPDADRTTITVTQKEIWQVERRLREKIVNATIEARKLLTPEQNAQLPDFSSGVVGEKGFNPIMCKMWGLGGLAG